MLPSYIQENLESEGYYLLFGIDSVPFNDLKFPTPNNRIQAVGPYFIFGENELTRKLNMEKNELIKEIEGLKELRSLTKKQASQIIEIIKDITFLDYLLGIITGFLANFLFYIFRKSFKLLRSNKT